MASIGIKIVQYNYDRHGRWQRNERKIAPEIGQLVNHSTKSIFLSISSGIPLQYYGKIGGVEVEYTTEAIQKFIDRSEEKISPEDIINPRLLGFQPEYFIVTELLQFKRMPELMDLLTRNFFLLARGTDYLIFDLRKRINTGP